MIKRENDRENQIFLDGVFLASNKIRKFARELREILQDEELGAKRDVVIRVHAILNVLQSVDKIICAESGDAIGIPLDETLPFRREGSILLQFAVEGRRSVLKKALENAKSQNDSPEVLAAIEVDIAKAPNDEL